MDEENKADEKKEVHSHQEGKLTKKMRENPWILSTFVLGVLALILLIGSFGGITGGVISGDEAGESFVSFINSQGEAQIEYISYEDLGSFYEVTVLSNGQETPVSLTKDGKYWAQGVIPLSTQPSQPNTPEPVDISKSEFSEEDKVKLLKFSECLADKGVKAYGAGWCGYCKKLKETFGGASQIEPFYIECQNADRTPTKNANICEEEEIRGFPTIKINGEASGLSALSSFEEFAEATGCPVPQLD